MSSTTGGFLLGVGLMILLVSSISAQVINNVYAQAYKEFLSYKDTFIELYDLTHSPLIDDLIESYRELANLISYLDQVTGTYRELVSLEPQFEELANYYEEVYPLATSIKNLADILYTITHSKEYNDMLQILKKLVEYINNPIVGSIIGPLIAPLVSYIEILIQLVEYSRELSTKAKELTSIIEKLPPYRVRSYINQFKSLTQALPPEKAEVYVTQTKQLLNMLPPDKLSKYLLQARTGSERALDIISTLEKYPPQTVLNYTLIGVIIGIVLMVVGIMLILSTGKKQTVTSTK